MIAVVTWVLAYCATSIIACYAWASLRAEQKHRTREELRRQTLAHALRQDVKLP